MLGAWLGADSRSTVPNRTSVCTALHTSALRVLSVSSDLKMAVEVGFCRGQMDGEAARVGIPCQIAVKHGGLQEPLHPATALRSLQPMLLPTSPPTAMTKSSPMTESSHRGGHHARNHTHRLCHLDHATCTCVPTESGVTEQPPIAQSWSMVSSLSCPGGAAGATASATVKGDLRLPCPDPTRSPAPQQRCQHRRAPWGSRSMTSQVLRSLYLLNTNSEAKWFCGAGEGEPHMNRLPLRAANSARQKTRQQLTRQQLTSKHRLPPSTCVQQSPP